MTIFNRHCDWWFLAACAALFFGGIITMYSLGLAKGQPWAYKQLVFGALAFVLFVAASELPLHFWRRRALLLVIIAVALLIAVWLFGAERKGAQRWIVIGGLSLQPVEFFKFAALLIGASFCARAAHTRLGWDLAQPLLLALFIPLALLLNQPDVGSFLLIITVSIAMLFLAGLKLR